MNSDGRKAELSYSANASTPCEGRSKMQLTGYVPDSVNAAALSAAPMLQNLCVFFASLRPPDSSLEEDQSRVAKYPFLSQKDLRREMRLIDRVQRYWTVSSLLSPG